MPSQDLPRIAQAFFNTPLLLHAGKAGVLTALFAERMTGVLPLDARPNPDADRFSGEKRGRKVSNGYETYTEEWYRLEQGCAIVTIEGALVNRGAFVGAYSGCTSYEWLRAALRMAADDADARAIILDFNSPGGEAIGCFELSAEIRRVAAQKPVIAFIDGMACSAAYAIASGATRIVTTATGMSGHIGVIMLHLDRSRQLEQQGVKPTLLFIGAHKADGNSLEPLPDAVKTDILAEMQVFYDQFVETVALGRAGRLDAEAIRATEARCFMGEAAVAAGIADEIGSLDTILARFGNRAGAKTQSGPAKPAASGKKRMSDQNEHLLDAETIRKEAHAAGKAEGKAEGIVEGVKQGREAALADFSAITGHELAKGREKQAQALALSGVSVEQATALLAVAPKETALSLDARMAGNAVPSFGAEGEAKPGPKIDAAGIYSSLNAKR